ncbi:MAG: hypothetical protein ABI863_10730 [Ginsengibacter sp.]
MKKITALFFLTLFLFNLFGYRFVFDYMQQKLNEQLEVRLDNNTYDESQLVELKIPIHLPYQTSWSSYQRYNGEIEINGILYKYVKRKVSNDTLFVMCIANTKKMHLETAKDDFFKISNDLMQNNNSKKSDNSKSAFKNLQGEYDRYSFVLNTISPGCSQQNCWLPISPKNLLSSPHISPEQPPDLRTA